MKNLTLIIRVESHKEIQDGEGSKEFEDVVYHREMSVEGLERWGEFGPALRLLTELILERRALESIENAVEEFDMNRQVEQPQ